MKKTEIASGLFIMFALLNLLATIIVGSTAMYSYIFTGTFIWLTGDGDRFAALLTGTVLLCGVAVVLGVLDD